MTRRHLVTLSIILTVSGCPGREAPPPQTPSPEPVDSAAAVGDTRLTGLADFTAEMMRRGAGTRTTAAIAEAIESVGGDLSIQTDTDYTAIQIRVLREHLELALEILSDMAQRPTFPADEIERHRRQELDRLSLMQSQPRWLARQAFHRFLFGQEHPYGHYDAEPESISRLNRDNLISFHREHYVPRNAFLLVVGDVEPDDVARLSERRFGSWEDRPAPELTIPTAQNHEERTVLVVHVPGATQSQIALGNVALSRADSNYIPLRVANQILGGSASARLFMNLREQCSYSYGVYSTITGLRSPGPISAGGAVEARHTAGALREIFGELESIRAETPPAEELGAALAYMIGYFPIITETADNLAELVTIQRVFDLPRDYWSTYRSNLAAVTAEDALEAARSYIHPDRASVVIVGDADQVAEPARRYGPVTVVSTEGAVLRQLDGLAGQWPGGEPDDCPELPESDDEANQTQPPAPAEARDLDFPEVHETNLSNGLEVLTVERHQLPLAYVRLVLRSGSASDPL